ncbi:aldo/keto reductase [Labrys neptuniae]
MQLPIMPGNAAPRRLGKTSVMLTPVGLGGGPMGDMFENLDEEKVRATFRGAWDAGIRYFDTSPWYGRGLSELRFGEALRQRPRSDFILSTKIGRTFHRPKDVDNYKGPFWYGGLSFQERFDYTYDGVMRAYEQSQMRLGINRIDLLLIHDLDVPHVGSADLVAQHFLDLERSGWRALEMLKHYGEIRGIGAGVNVLGTIPEMLKRFDLDFFLVAMPYTLIDQGPLDLEFPLCQERGVGVVIGSPFASGILATGAGVPTPYYRYTPAAPEIIEKVRKIEAVCVAHNVPLKAAAFQFVLRHPIVASVISGAVTPEQARENVSLLGVAIPDAFWSDLRQQGLIHARAP